MLEKAKFQRKIQLPFQEGKCWWTILKRQWQCCQMAYFQIKNPDFGYFFVGSCNRWYRNIILEFVVFMRFYYFSYGYLVKFVAIWYSLWPFGKFYGYFGHFLSFWYAAPRKIWQPGTVVAFNKWQKFFFFSFVRVLNGAHYLMTGDKSCFRKDWKWKIARVPGTNVMKTFSPKKWD
jgi:hypothetical protein